MSKKVKIEPVRSSESASLYTIIFEDGDMSEFAKFLNRFKDNGKLQRDYQLFCMPCKKFWKMECMNDISVPRGNMQTEYAHSRLTQAN